MCYPVDMDTGMLVEKDSRGRLALGQLLDHDRYIVTRDEVGRLLLEPAVVLTLTEQRLLGDPGFLQRVKEGIEADSVPLDFDAL